MLIIKLYIFKVRNLELGYEVATLNQIFENLVQFYRGQDTARPLMGDFQLGIELLYRLQAYNNMFNNEGANPAPSIQVRVKKCFCNKDINKKSRIYGTSDWLRQITWQMWEAEGKVGGRKWEAEVGGRGGRPKVGGRAPLIGSDRSVRESQPIRGAPRPPTSEKWPISLTFDRVYQMC